MDIEKLLETNFNKINKQLVFGEQLAARGWEEIGTDCLVCGSFSVSWITEPCQCDMKECPHFDCPSYVWRRKNGY